jgi:photosystem II stability/assembly factor-like uncharacterized protein
MTTKKLLTMAILTVATTALVYHTQTIIQKNKSLDGKEEMPTVYEMMGVWGEMRAYPYKKIPEGKFNEAFKKYRDDIKLKTSLLQQRNNVSAPTIPWTPLAPKNFSGRILCMAFHPTNSNIMWVGSASGGLWKTTNGGTGAPGGINWTNVPTGFPVLGISAIVINPSNPNEIYLGTGEVYNSGAAGYEGHDIRTFRGSYGIGILKSTDGGITWTKSLDFSYSNLKGVQDMIINPQKPSTIFAATTDGVYRSHNSGSSWNLVHNIPMAMDICLKPGDTSTLYVGCGNFKSSGHGIYRSTNAGSSSPGFSKLSSGLPSTFSGMVRLHISANNRNKVYASIGKAPGTSDPNGLYASTNSGSSWSKVSQTAYINNQGWYAHDVIANPSNANSIFVAEMDTYRSTNGGSSLTKISDWSRWDFNNITVGATNEGTSSNYVHADIHHLYYSPFNNNTIFACTDGGLFKSTNSGSSFIGLNGGLMTAQIYSNMAVSAADPNFMICGLQDNATFVYSGLPGCKRKIGGDGFSAAIDPTNDNTCFGSLYYFTVYKSTNRSSTFSRVYNNSSGSERACFSAPLVMATSDPNIMYGGTIYVKKSTNKGTNWTNANGGLVLSNNSAPLVTVAVSNTNASLLYAATVPGGGARSKIFKSTNGAASFVEITGSLPDRFFTDIAVDPTNDSRIAVTLSGYGSGHVFLSNDGGTSWTEIGQGLPDVPHNTAVFDPANPQTIVVGNDLGVYYCTSVTDGSVSPEWLPFNDGLSDATLVMDMVVTSDNRLRLGTHGKGLWETNMPEGEGELIPSRTDPRITPETSGLIVSRIYPNPVTNNFNISLKQVPAPARCQVRIFNSNGQLVMKRDFELIKGSNLLTIDAQRLSSGTYQVTMEGTDMKFTQSIIKK